jgi:hypothetical protein
MSRLIALVSLVATIAALATITAPSVAVGATCSDYANQAQAQQAADTIDANGNGIYCEDLPCPCLKPGGTAPTGQPSGPSSSDCTKPTSVVTVGISETKYPAVLAHMRRAIRAGWPRVLTIHREGAAARRERALAGIPTREGYDRDEWPMAFARRSWRTDVAYVPSDQNRGAGARVGIKLRRYCDGTRFRIVGY